MQIQGGKNKENINCIIIFEIYILDDGLYNV